ncbi:hypothetical protein [Frisingicoccus sp.]
MKCPKCNGETRIINSRLKEWNEVYRRRKCLGCGFRFSTMERIIGNWR